MLKKSCVLFLLLVSIQSIAGGSSSQTHSGANQAEKTHSLHNTSGHGHKKGGWMFSLRTMDMHMENNLDGSRGISSDEIVTTIPNRFYGVSGQPATLRVAPIKMDSRMDMFSLMYAQTDTLSWMLMLHHIEKSMEFTTYMGGSGTTQRGNFKTKSSGMGHTALSVLWKTFDKEYHQVRLNLGISLPTGDIDQKDFILTPMGMKPKSVLPYGMQLGSGTYDFLPGFTYFGNNGSASDWGFKYQAVLRIGENDKDYTLGDNHKFSTWGAYSLAPWIKTSLGLSYKYEDDINGIDTRVVLPVQTADPDNYGGDTFMAHFGVTFSGQNGYFLGHKIKFEYSKQLDQNLNGIQMEMDDMFSASYQFSL